MDLRSQASHWKQSSGFTVLNPDVISVLETEVGSPWQTPSQRQGSLFLQKRKSCDLWWTQREVDFDGRKNHFNRRWAAGSREGMSGKGVELEPFNLMLRAFNSFSVFKWSC